MKKMAQLAVALLLVLAGIVALFKHELNQIESYRAAKILLLNERGNNIDDFYLSLFKKVKNPDGETEGRQPCARNRDPFAIPTPVVRTAETTKTRKTGLKLGGVLWDEKAPSAIINEKIVQVGNRVAGYRVVRITPSRVLLSAGRENRVLEIPGLGY